MPKLEVRCCCQPEKLLGWIEVANPNAKRVVLTKPFRFKLERVGILDSSPITRKDEPPLELPIQRIWMDGEAYYAVKAEGYTAEQLAEYLGFTPNDQPGVQQ